MLVKEGVMDSVSLEAYPKKTVRTREGVVRRVKAHLRTSPSPASAPTRARPCSPSVSGP